MQLINSIKYKTKPYEIRKFKLRKIYKIEVLWIASPLLAEWLLTYRGREVKYKHIILVSSTHQVAAGT